MKHAFTIDTEDWAKLMCSYLGLDIQVSEQFEPSINRILSLLEQYDTRATFFVVAAHAEQHPDIVRTMTEAGHEVASHGWTHKKVRSFSPDELRRDIRRSIDLLEQITGEKVRGHRSPFFSLMPEHTWAWKILSEAGLDFDSSLTTLLWEQENVHVPKEPFVCELSDGREIVEFPALAQKYGPITGRLIGGRSIRLLPRSFYLSYLQDQERRSLPAMLYAHSYEVTPDGLVQYIPPKIAFTDRMKLFVAAKTFELGMGRMHHSLCHLLEAYEWAPMSEVIAEVQNEGTLPRVKVEGDGRIVHQPSKLN